MGEFVLVRWLIKHIIFGRMVLHSSLKSQKFQVGTSLFGLSKEGWGKSWDLVIHYHSGTQSWSSGYTVWHVLHMFPVQHDWFKWLYHLLSMLLILYSFKPGVQQQENTLNLWDSGPWRWRPWWGTSVTRSQTNVNWRFSNLSKSNC